MGNRFLKISRLLFGLFFAALPFQIDLLLFDGSRLVGSFFNPYFAHFIYLSDVFLILSMGVLGVAVLLGSGPFKPKDGDKRHMKLMALFLSTYVISLIFSFNYLNSFFYLLRAGEFFLIYYLLWRGFLDMKSVGKFLGSALLIVSLLGIYQFLFQRNFGVHFLGEPLLDPEKLGVAKMDLMDEKKIRAYGTFAHPNVFGGYLVVGIFLILSFLKGEKRFERMFWRGAVAVLAIGLAFTFSRSAWISIFLGWAVFSLDVFRGISRKQFSLIAFSAVLFVILVQLFPVFYERMLFTDFANIRERFLYIAVSLKMFISNVWGVGVGNFTGVMQQYADYELMPWLLQPVHNVFLLILNELGFIGLSIFCVVLFYSFSLILKKRAKKINSPLFAILAAMIVISLFDHYLFSLYQGQALFWTVFGLIGRGD